MYRLTQEQEAIIKASKTQPKIKIKAYAGTGKTSTLIDVTLANPNKRILNLCFNKSIATEASKRFPKNVTSKTTHSLAYGKMVFGKYKGSKVGFDYKSYEIRKIYNMNYNQESIIRDALEILNDYFNSGVTSLEITKEDFPQQMRVITLANKILEDLRMSPNSILPRITHSFYLKEFQLLLANNVMKINNVDLVLLDEAQDTNEVTMSIFNNINAPQRILVGDEHQSIYSWRGASNIFSKLEDYEEFTLSQSFRLDIPIANSASKMLELGKLETLPLKGIKRDDKSLDDFKTKGIISRTNSMLIQEMVAIIERNQPFTTIRPPSAIFEVPIDLYNLAYKRGNIKNKHFEIIYEDYVKKVRKALDIKDKEEYLNDGFNFFAYLEKLDDLELKQAGRLLLNYSAGIFQFLKIADMYYKMSQDEWDMTYPNVTKTILTTAHTSKGLEFDHVELTNDFKSISSVIYDVLKVYYNITTIEDLEAYISYRMFRKIPMNDDSIQGIIEEINLLYVAITRAKYLLDAVNYTKDLSIEEIERDLQGMKKQEISKLKERKD